MKRKMPAAVWITGGFLVLFALLCAALLRYSYLMAAIAAGLWLAMAVTCLVMALSYRRRIHDVLRWFCAALGVMVYFYFAIFRRLRREQSLK